MLQTTLELKQVLFPKAIANRYFVSSVPILRVQEELVNVYTRQWGTAARNPLC
ncbi:hypothetical protein [Vagococcus elongatus]